jgi:antitoxin (DNA-binding transcriptional repressor) of toxin-antitoxin stability system
MKKMSVSQFKAECLSLFDNLDPDGLDITKHGKVVARVVPVEQQSSSLIGSMKGKIKKKGPILSTGVKWNAES